MRKFSFSDSNKIECLNQHQEKEYNSLLQQVFRSTEGKQFDSATFEIKMNDFHAKSEFPKNA